MEPYTIKSYGEDFCTGNTTDGRQVLMGLLCPELVAVFFDREGRLLRVEARALSQLPPRQGTIGVSWETDEGVQSLDGLRSGPYQVSDPEFQVALAQDLEMWKREIQFEDAPIAVYEFFLDDRYIGIQPLPDDLQEFKDDPDNAATDDEERRMLEESMEEWERLGQYVLWWGKDYWMNRKGEVEST